jgi:hypothetical protein
LHPAQARSPLPIPVYSLHGFGLGARPPQCRVEKSESCPLMFSITSISPEPGHAMPTRNGDPTIQYAGQ